MNLAKYNPVYDFSISRESSSDLFIYGKWVYFDVSFCQMQLGGEVYILTGLGFIKVPTVANLPLQWEISPYSFAWQMCESDVKYGKEVQKLWGILTNYSHRIYHKIHVNVKFNSIDDTKSGMWLAKLKPRRHYRPHGF